MAGDWIKMRVSLVNHPKVLALSEELSHYGDYQEWSGLAGFIPSMGGTQKSFDDEIIQALRVTRYVTVTALLRFWGYANEHSKEEFIASLRISDIDEIAGIPSFGLAMEAIGWAIYDESRKGIVLPNFTEHNATANDRGAADRQKRYRERKKLRDVTGDVTSDITPLHREEKRREEKKDINKPSRRKSKTTIPDGFSISAGVKEWAEKNGYQRLDERLAHFITVSQAKGYEYADWDAAFRNAISGDWAKLGGATLPVGKFDVNEWLKTK